MNKFMAGFESVFNSFNTFNAGQGVAIILLGTMVTVFFAILILIAVKLAEGN